MGSTLTSDIARKTERDWQRLCDSYLLIRPKGSIWWFSRKRNGDDLAQGWKLHVSATILSACSVFRLVAPYLRERDILFKAAKSLSELQKLNSGFFYGYSQIGKFITVYPPSTEAALAIAAKLDSLTANQPAPMVPYDNALRNGSCVYYRYGSFSPRTKITFRKKRVVAIARTAGKLVPDRRAPGAAVPHWLDDPFQAARPCSGRGAVTPLETTYCDYEALVQRGRGGVYRARDVSSVLARPCIIKEGRRHGETGWDGEDGFDRVKREARFLRSISNQVAALPRLITTFQANGCFYLVTEPIDGRSLHSVITGRERISTRRMLKYVANMARIVADIHAAGCAWRDCKPANFLVQKDRKLRALDFEGACRFDEGNPPRWGTPGYTPPEGRRNTGDLESADLYALGTSIMELIARSNFRPNLTVAFQREIRKRKLHRLVGETIRNLRSPKARMRPSARGTQRLFEKLQKLLNTYKSRGGPWPDEPLRPSVVFLARGR
jgi:hypothetical protein